MPWLLESAVYVSVFACKYVFIHLQVFTEVLKEPRAAGDVHACVIHLDS